MTNPDRESDASPDELDETAYLDSFGDLCAAFEDAVEKGLNPDIGEIVESARCNNREALFRELLKIETRSRSENGQPKALAEYLDQFPEYEAEIESVLGERANEKTLLTGSSGSLTAETPDSIGRFKIVRLLGIGGFGRVYLARDPKLKRDVAIKVMRSGISHSDEVLKEAQSAAQLNHEAIVRIYDVDVDAAEPYIVQEYVKGESLADRLKKGQSFSTAEAIQLMIRLADALGFAHRHRLFHRDLKPGNVLIERSGMPRLIDFGLAIHEEDREQHRGEIAGSIGYMAPEQFRGESHRVDDRTDIWSLCVIFYRLLTGRLPFDGSSGGLVAEEVQFVDHVSMRQLDATIPATLDRIVGKGLAKRMVDRYSSCSELIEELEIVRDSSCAGDVSLEGQPPEAARFVATRNESGSAAELASDSLSDANVLVVPRGLSSFSEADSKFYPSLLPGPFDRDGLPTSIGFWLDRIANVDPAKAVPIGVVYGRSGCGKSSLVRAGILPRLSRNVIPVYADCTDRGTEQRIIEAVDASFGESTCDMDILRRFVAIRESSRRKRNPKVLIILDQFEQWLHGRTNIAQERLTMALRQCDGVSLQVLIVVRDDFWLAVSQFLRAIEVPIAEDQNTMAVELFGKRHARDVLKRFGLAYGAIPKTVEQQTDDHNRFLDIAISDLSDGAHVPCVTLSLFAHMFKGQDWTGAALSSMGGTDAVGVQYLERVFDRDAGPLLLRRYAKQARNVLELLLPAHGSTIKGHTRTRAELQERTELEEAELGELLRLLDKELSLIGVSDDTTGTSAATERKYRLAHDYMVNPIRSWNASSQRRSRRGRAMLDLRESASVWDEQRVSGLLPSTFDYIRFRTLTPGSERRPIESDYLEAWERHNFKRILASFVLIAVALVAGNWYLSRTSRKAVVASKLKGLGQIEEGFDDFADGLGTLRLRTEDLKEVLESSDTRLRIRGWLLKARLDGEEWDAEAVRKTIHCIEDCDPLEGRQLVRLLRREQADAVREVRKKYLASKDLRQQSRLASVLLLLGDTSGASDLVKPNTDPLPRSLITQHIADWSEDLSQVATMLRDSDTKPVIRSAMADAIALGWPDVEETQQPSIRVACKELLRVGCEQPTLVSSVAHILEADAGYAMPPGTEPARGDNWFVNSVSLRLLRLGPKSGKHGNTFLSDREISNRLIHQFLAKPDGLRDERVEAVRDHALAMPADMVSLETAVQFCNWLSEREELSPSYEPTESGWRLVDNAGGYRVPGFEELDFAARGIAGPSYPWHCMSSPDDVLLANYESTAHEIGKFVSGGVSLPVGSRLPNSLGFFDTLGSVREWVWTRNPRDASLFYIYGGSSKSSANRVKAGFSVRDPDGLPPALRKARVGFRIAITRGTESGDE